MAELLHYEWPDGSGKFSFDLGGRFLGGDINGQSFVAEVKNYIRDHGGLRTHFQDFLAKCYIDATRTKPRYKHYLWISWAPFNARSWDKHGKPDDVRDAVLLPRNRQRCLQTEDEDEGRERISNDAIAAIGNHTWLITMNDRQNELVVTKEHFALIVAQIKSEGGSA